MRCEDAVAELMQAIADDSRTLSSEARAHLRECARCAELLQTLSGEATTHDAPVDTSAAAAERALAHERRKVLFARTGGTVAAIIVFGGLFAAISSRPLGLARGEFLMVFFVALSIATLLAVPLLLLARVGRRFHKRLGPGRWLDGVCLGIAEGTGVNVGVIRLAFVLAAVFGHGLGFLAYVICTSAMQVHPADRKYLLRFKIARAWRRMRHGAEEAEQHG